MSQLPEIDALLRESRVFPPSAEWKTNALVNDPAIYELIEQAPKTGNSPTIWAWPQIVEYLKVAGQPVQGPWPPHQEPRPDPEAESLPVAIPDPQSFPRQRAPEPGTPPQA